MKFNSIIYTLASFIALGEAKKYNFNVISIMGDSVSLGVKFDNNVVPLTSTNFPLFTGSVEADNISQFNYVAIDGNGELIDEESIIRNYEDKKSNDVYNRQPKDIQIPRLDEPFKRQFSMGSEKLQPLPTNVIYNVYANCDINGYTEISTFPFSEDGAANRTPVNCTFNIVAPDYQFTSSGNAHILGYGSRTYRKLSWGFKFDKKFLGRKSVKMRAMASDPTLIREKLCIELYKSVGVPVQEGTYARLIINNDVYGLYLIIDSLSSKWIKSYVHGDDKATLGATYKLYSTHPQGPYADFKYQGDDYQVYQSSGTYRIDEFDEQGMTTDLAQWSPLVNFIQLFNQWVQNYDNDMSDKAVDELKKFFNIESYLRMIAIDTLTLAIDNFYLYNSNAALYYNPQRNNYIIIPYDFDQSLVGTKGNEALDSENFMSDCLTWVNHADGEIFDHYFTNSIMKHPQIKQRYDVILAKALAQTYDPVKIHAFVHANADLIRDDVAWNFELIKTLNIGYKNSERNSFVNYFTIENFEGNIDYEHVGYDGTNYDDANYGIQEFVELRSKECKAYTANVDTSNDKNISDDYNDVKVYKAVSNGSATTFSMSIFLLVLSQVFLYLLL